MARHGRRAGAAIAAATIALAAPVAIATFTLSDESRAEPDQYLAPDQLRIDGYGSGAAGVGAMQRAEQALRVAYPDADVSPVIPAVVEAENRNGKEREHVIVIDGPLLTTAEGVQYHTNGFLLIGTGELLRALHAEDGIEALERGDVVGIGPDAKSDSTLDLLIDGREQGGPYREGLPTATAGERSYTAIGFSELTYVIDPARAAELGLRPASGSAWGNQALFRAPHDLSDGDIEHVRDVLADDRLIGVVALGDLTDDATFVRMVATVGGVVIALAIVAVVVALLAGESRRDRAILVAVGAGPATRRVVSGLYAAVVGALAGVLGFTTGFVPATVLLHGQAQAYPIVFPWVAVAGLLGVPMIAGVIGALVSRRPEPGDLLRPIA